MRSGMRFLALLALAAAVRAGENWPEFRGPTGQGHSDARGLPLTWSPTKNVVWKTPIHDRGWSSPVVWRNQVWVTTATRNGKRMYAVCVHRETGKIVHDVKVFDTPDPERIATVNSYASPTSAIELARMPARQPLGAAQPSAISTTTAMSIWLWQSSMDPRSCSTTPRQPVNTG